MELTTKQKLVKKLRRKKTNLLGIELTKEQLKTVAGGDASYWDPDPEQQDPWEELILK